MLPDAGDTDGLPGDTGCIDLDDAPVAVGEWVDRAIAGDRVLILRAGQPVAQLVPVRRKPGGWEGQVRIGEDFDEPLPQDILNAFGLGVLGPTPYKRYAQLQEQNRL